MCDLLAKTVEAEAMMVREEIRVLALCEEGWVLALRRWTSHEHLIYGLAARQAEKTETTARPSSWTAGRAVARVAAGPVAQVEGLDAGRKAAPAAQVEESDAGRNAGHGR